MQDEIWPELRRTRSNDWSDVSISNGINPLKPELNTNMVVSAKTSKEKNERNEQTVRQKMNNRRIYVEFSTDEKTLIDRLSDVFLQNRKSGMFINYFTFVMKLVLCSAYVLEMCIENPHEATCAGCPPPLTSGTTTVDHKDDHNFTIHWHSLLWVNRPYILWTLQVVLSFITLCQVIITSLLKYHMQTSRFLNSSLLLEIVISIPFIVSLFIYPLRNLYVPSYLNCWLAKYVLEDISNLHLQRFRNAFSYQLMNVMASLLCLIFTSICGFQHIQRAGKVHVTIFESFYFTVVTLATVGFGDFTPDIWPSQLFVIIMLAIAFKMIPRQFETLAGSWLERQRLGGAYHTPVLNSSKNHVVVCCTVVNTDTIVDFLKEFYSHRILQDYSVVILSPCDLNRSARQVLQSPTWNQRVLFLKGSCLRDIDLQRAKLQDARGCFLLRAGDGLKKSMSDEHTILRSWAIQDFAPNVPQLIQIYKPENKMHVQFIDSVVCEEEFKNAMLSYNCMIPGTSTLITLLLHTSKGHEGQQCKEPWLRMYGRCSGNEIYSIILGESIIFSEYEGGSFTQASVRAHRKFGVGLIGVRPMSNSGQESSILLNPGSNYVLRRNDLLFYLSITKEEHMTFYFDQSPSSASDDIEAVAKKVDSDDISSSTRFGRDLSQSDWNVEYFFNNEKNEKTDVTKPKYVFETEDDIGLLWRNQRLVNEEIIIDYPHVTPYIGTAPTLCYLLRNRRQPCCLYLAEECQHSAFKCAADYNWITPAIIFITDVISCAIYNFIVPLRAHFHQLSELKPIVLLALTRPQQTIIDTLAWFPYVYWMLGSVDSLDDVLRAGIITAESVVFVSKEKANGEQNEDMDDSNTIVAVQTVYKLFPRIKITTELSQSANMRFMHFQPNNSYSLYLADIEKQEKDKGSNISFMFRQQFASGHVFSSGMLDNLLYQVFAKDYLLNIVRLLLGIEHSTGSGFLTSMKVHSEQMLMKTYGNLYSKICETSGDIPLAIYRTFHHKHNDNHTAKKVARERSKSAIEKREISNLIRARMQNMGLSTKYYDHPNDDRSPISYVIINPGVDLELQIGDIIYILRQNHG